MYSWCWRTKHALSPGQDGWKGRKLSLASQHPKGIVNSHVFWTRCVGSPGRAVLRQFWGRTTSMAVVFTGEALLWFICLSPDQTGCGVFVQWDEPVWVHDSATQKANSQCSIACLDHSGVPQPRCKWDHWRGGHLWATTSCTPGTNLRYAGEGISKVCTWRKGSLLHTLQLFQQ